MSIAQNLAAQLKNQTAELKVANDRLLAVTRDYAGLQVNMGRKQAEVDELLKSTHNLSLRIAMEHIARRHTKTSKHIPVQAALDDIAQNYERFQEIYKTMIKEMNLSVADAERQRKNIYNEASKRVHGNIYPFTLTEMVPTERCVVGSYLAWDGTFKLDETRDVWKFQIE